MAYEGTVIFSLVSGVGGVLNAEGAVYLAADGRSVPKAQYPALYAVVSGRYGESGSDFYIPDIRGYYLRGDSLDSNRDGDYPSRVLYGPAATATGVGTYQPASMLTHSHYHAGSLGPAGRNPSSAPGSSRLYNSPQPNTLTTSGVDSATMTWPNANVSGIDIASGTLNPPTYTYYAYIKAN